MNNEILFKYTIKPNNKPEKTIKINYYKLIKIIGYDKIKDRFGISYIKANTPQIIDVMNALTSLKEVSSVNVYIDNQIIL